MYGFLPPGRVHRRKPCAQCQSADAHPIGDKERVRANVKRIYTALKFIKGGRDLVNSPYFR